MNKMPLSNSGDKFGNVGVLCGGTRRGLSLIGKWRREKKGGV